MLVPDLLQPNLRMVLCGSAPSRASLAAQAYYANTGNQFWPVLARVGLTPRLLSPAEYPCLLEFGIGLTDLCKTHSGNDDEIPDHGWDTNALKTKIELFQPKLLAFTSKNSAQRALGCPVEYGLQQEAFGTTGLFVCCSTSGRARRFWREDIWEELSVLFSRIPA